MIGLKHGIGGYGGISTLNTDQRGPRYGPHILISREVDMFRDIVHVTCLTCGEVWEHPRGERTWPTKC